MKAPAKTPTSGTIATTFSKSEEDYIQRHAKRVAKIVRAKYKSLNPSYDVVWNFEFVHTGMFGADVTPRLSINLLRFETDGSVWTQTSIFLKYAFGNIPGRPDAKPRQALLLDVDVFRPGPNVPRHRSLNQRGRRMQDAPALALDLVQTACDMGLIEYPGMKRAHYLPRTRFMPAIPQHTLATAEEEDSKPRRQARRRQWTRREKFAHERMDVLRREFLRQSGHMFKTVIFEVNPQAETFRLAFHAKKAFEGRYVELEGTYDISYDRKTHRADAMHLQVRKASLRRDFTAAATDPIDILEKDVASAEILSLLRQTQALAFNAEAEQQARLEREMRPHARARRRDNRRERRGQQATTRSMVRNTPS